MTKGEATKTSSFSHLTRAGAIDGTKALADPTHATTATAEQNFILSIKVCVKLTGTEGLVYGSTGSFRDH